MIVADDGSIDGTARLVQARARQWPQLRLVRLGRNAGKGAAVRAGMLAARGDLRLFTDADMSTPIDQLPRLREAIHGATAIAIGSRAVPGAVIEVHQPRRREFMGRGYNRLLRLLALPGLHDTQCGFKLFTAEAAEACFEPLQTLRFGFDAEVLLRARRRGWRIAEVGVHWRHADESRVSPLRGLGGHLQRPRPPAAAPERLSRRRSRPMRRERPHPEPSRLPPDAAALRLIVSRLQWSRPLMRTRGRGRPRAGAAGAPGCRPSPA